MSLTDLMALLLKMGDSVNFNQFISIHIHIYTYNNSCLYIQKQFISIFTHGMKLKLTPKTSQSTVLFWGTIYESFKRMPPLDINIQFSLYFPGKFWSVNCERFKYKPIIPSQPRRDMRWQFGFTMSRTKFYGLGQNINNAV